MLISGSPRYALTVTVLPFSSCIAAFLNITKTQDNQHVPTLESYYFIIMEKRPILTSDDIGKTNKSKKGLMLVASLDYCYRFRPLIDRATFQEQLQYTQGKVITYFPKDISAQYRSYQATTKYVTIAFWVLCFGFAGFCHRISPIRRVLGQGSWKMFGFKIAALVVPFLAMDSIMPEAESQEVDFLWSKMKEPYRRYKYSGDILELNPNIALTGPGITQAAQPLL